MPASAKTATEQTMRAENRIAIDVLPDHTVFAVFRSKTATANPIRQGP
jgi:hypothetical protein